MYITFPLIVNFFSRFNLFMTMLAVSLDVPEIEDIFAVVRGISIRM